jgi:M6 family metalloprotease-like protein
VPSFAISGNRTPVHYWPLKHRAATTNLRVCALRVSFIPDDDPATTGNGDFLTSSNTPCTEFCVDPPPHHRAYFGDHLQALHNYYSKVSRGKVTLDLANSLIFPLDDARTYRLPHQMAYYHPFLQKDSINLRLAELFYDAVQAADHEVDFSQFDVVIVFHAGIGQDFDITLDPTPYDIPSVFINLQDLQALLAPEVENFPGIIVDNGYYLQGGLILPETQNHLLFENWQEVFGNVNMPCEYQIGLNGTLAFIFGFYLGLPALYDTETGTTGIGKFGLMDQGSANLNGLAPAVPSAWERVFLGWDTPIEVQLPAVVNLSEVESYPDTSVLKITLNSTEYFLIENRNAHVHPGISLDSIQYEIYTKTGAKSWPSIFPLIKDTLKAQFSTQTGVMLSIPKYDYGLPGSGLLIWHIDESIIQSNLSANKVNLNKERRGVDLEEGDGAQDLGYDAGILGTQINIGWYFDPWFAGNEGFFHLNPNYPKTSDKRVGFTPYTNPSTSTNDYLPTGIAIDSIGPAGRVMNFRIHNLFAPVNYPLSFQAPVTRVHVVSNPNDPLAAFLVASDSTYIFNAAGNRTATAPIQNDYLIADQYITAWSSINDSTALLTSWELTQPNYELNMLRQSLLTNRAIYSGRGLAIGKHVLLVTHTVNPPQYQLGSYHIFDGAWEWLDLDQPLIKLLGDSLNCFGIGSDNKVYAINFAPFPCYPIRDITNISQGSHLVAFINDNSTADLIHYFDGVLTVYFDLESNGEVRSSNVTLIGELACGDIDNDGKVEIIGHDATQIYAFNQTLRTEYNFTLDLPNILKGDHFAGNLRLADINDDGIQEILITTSKALIAFDNLGQVCPNFPLSIFTSSPESSFMLNTNTGIRYLTLTTSNQITALNLGAGVLSMTDWYCQGGNLSRNYLCSIKPSSSQVTSRHLLNGELTFNWPNPVRAKHTNIRYYVNAPCNIQIRIYDLAGDLVASFEDGSPRVREINEKEWYTEDIGSGVYFAVIQAKAGARSESKILKIMVIK